MVKYQYFGIFGDMVGAMENLTMLLDRAHQVVLGTSMESLEQCSWANLGWFYRDFL
jgi:hypothetical protein